MGCDIHGFIEVYLQGEWHTVAPLSLPLRERNYDFFAQVADVRGYSTHNRHTVGCPDDASAVVQAFYDKQGLNYHSWSVVSLYDFLYLFQKIQKGQTIDKADTFDVADSYRQYDLKYISNDVSDFRVIMYFDS